MTRRSKQTERRRKKIKEIKPGGLIEWEGGEVPLLVETEEDEKGGMKGFFADKTEKRGFHENGKT